jgi:serine/threonine-protein kinase
MILSAGVMVAGYRIERSLGAGGMGAVYLAQDPHLPRLDALKVLSADLSRDPDFRARFVREANVASKLDHPNIVSVYNRGETEDGQLWIAMQFVEGTDADAALRAGTMTPVRAVHVVTEVAKALDHAHHHNVVHRDIKPANFLLSGPPGPTERVLLADFGIARALDDIGLTVTGAVMATVAYAAPEVLAGQPFDRRADIYSLGCSMFRMLTGQTPFASSQGLAAVMMAHLQQPPPRVTDFVPTLPAGLDWVIATAMAKDPARRYGSAGDLAAAAAAALQNATEPTAPTRPVPGAAVIPYPPAPPDGALWWQHIGAPRTMQAAPTPAPPRRTRRWIIGAATAAVMLVAATVAVVFWPPGDSSPSGTPNPRSSGSAAPQSPGSPQAPPATDVPASALRSILLTAAEIPGNTGAGALVLEMDSADLLNDSATIDNQQCLGAWAPAQQPVYANSGPLAPGGPTGAAVQVLRSVNAKAWQNSVIQAAVAMPNQLSAVGMVQTLQRQFQLCEGKAVTVTPPGEVAQTWDFGQPATMAGAVTLVATLRGGEGSCQRGIADVGNVVIDIRLCRPPGTDDVTALVNATANKVPRQ